MAASTASGLFPASDLIEAMLEVSLTAMSLSRPCYDEAGRLVDFSLEYLNAAGQRMLGLPERHAGRLRTLFPNAQAAGVVDFYRGVFETHAPGHYALYYPYDGLHSHFQLAARRSGDWLVVSFSDAAEQERSSMEQVLRETQMRERAALAEADAQRQRLQAAFMQAPACIASVVGPEHVFELANPLYQQLVGGRPLLGKTIREALPELEGQPFFGLLDEVYRTGETFFGREVPALLDRTNSGQLETAYFNFIYQASRGVSGGVTGVLIFAYDITEQVLARQQVQQLNQELEARVQERTQAALAAQADAERQRRRLERFFQQAPAAIAVLNGPRHTYELVNPAYEQLLPGRELLGRAVLEAVPEIEDTPLYRMLEEVYASGQAQSQQNLLVPVADAAGQLQERYFTLICQARLDGTGHVDGLLLFGFEVTEQVLAEQRAAVLQAEVLAAARRQVEERATFEQVFVQTPALVALLHGPEHTFTFVNPAFQQVFPGREFVGRTHAQVLPEAEAYTRMLDQVYTTRQPVMGREMALRLPDAAGRARTLYFDFTYQAYGSGSTTGICVFAFEVTEQVLARRERETRQQQMNELFEQAPVAIAVLRGPDFIVDLANPAVCALWDCTPEAALNQPVLELPAAATGPALERVLRQVLASGVPYAVHEQPWHQAGRPADLQYLDFLYQPMRDVDGQVTGVMIVASDVSESVLARHRLAEANEALTATNQQLLRTNADLDNFIYTASHDLKQPIANIEGLLNALHYQLPPAVLQESVVASLLTMMQQAVGRFQQTIVQLTDVSKLQQASSLPAEPIDLAALIEDVRLDLAPLLAEADARLVVDTASCAEVLFTPKNLRSIIYNLLSNAVKYRQPGRRPEVTIRSHCTPTATTLEVQDNGLGLTPLQQSKLFGMFQRLHDHVEGSGIGLYMVKKIIENAGGTISVQSQPGVGSTFTVTLPN